jgi:biotin carboxylase
MKKRIMILGASILQVPAITKAKEMGLEVVAVDMDKNAVGFRDADICLPISTIDVPMVVEAAKEYHVNGVMTLASDMPMRTVAAVAKDAVLVGIDAETAVNATNKAVMRQILGSMVSNTEFFKVSCRYEYDKQLSITYPKV